MLRLTGMISCEMQENMVTVEKKKTSVRPASYFDSSISLPPPVFILITDYLITDYHRLPITTKARPDYVHLNT